MPLEQPLVPMSLFKVTNYSAVACSSVVGTMIYFSMTILWPLQISALYTTDNIQIGWLSVSILPVSQLPFFPFDQILDEMKSGSSLKADTFSLT